MIGQDEGANRGWYDVLIPRHDTLQEQPDVDFPKRLMLRNILWFLGAILVLGAGMRGLSAVRFGGTASTRPVIKPATSALYDAGPSDTAIDRERAAGLSGVRFHHSSSAAYLPPPTILHVTFSQHIYYCINGACYAQDSSLSRPSVPVTSAVPPYTPGSRRIPVAPVPSAGLWRQMTLKRLTFNPDGIYQVPVSQADLNTFQDASAAVQKATGMRLPAELLLAQAAQRSGLYATVAGGIFCIARSTQLWIAHHAPRSLGLQQFSPYAVQQAAEAMGWYDAYLQQQFQKTTGDKGWVTTLVAETMGTTPTNIAEPQSAQQADNDLAAASNINTEMQDLSIFIQSEVKLLGS
jgi:hypothetical protein